MFISSGNLTKTVTVPSSGLKIHGTGIAEGMAARIVVPSWPGTAVKLLMAIHTSTDNSTYRIESTYKGGNVSYAKTASGQEFIIPLKTNRKYAKMVFTLTNGTTGTSFGAVRAGLVTNVGYDWQRAKSFE